MSGLLALFLLAAATAVPAAARAQQPEMRVVTLLSQDRGMVDSTPVATKDIVSQLASQSAGRARLPMITIRNCEKVPPDTIQGLTQELQKRSFVVALDFDRPDARLCAR